MIKNYLLVTLRSLAKNKLFIFINVFGMGVAIACCIVAYVNWDYANSWDKSFTSAHNVYRVQFWREFQNSTQRYGLAPIPLASYIKNNSSVNAAVRYHISYCDIRIGDEIFGTQMAFADSAFFDLFNYDLKYGAFTDFHDKSRVFISDEVARKYFNKEDVVGQLLTQIVLGKDGVRRPKEFVIGGVFVKKPMNTSFGFEAITLFDNFWDINLDEDASETSWKRWVGALFLKIESPQDVATVTTQLQQYVEPQNKVREDFQITRYYLENFDGMMKRNRANPRINSDYLSGGIPDEAVTVPAIMAFMLLLLACFNFTNTSIAISSRRLKEIGIRKVMGGIRKQLVLQFLGENFLLCIFGLIAGILMAEWLVPTYASLWPWLDLKLSYTDNAGFLLFIVALLFLTAIIAGSYPSFYITSHEPVSILKGTAKFGGTNWFTRILLGGQFFISLLSIVFGVAFYKNGEYQRDYDLGFATHGVISTWVADEGAYNSYRDALASNPDIKLIAGTNHHIATSFYNDPVKFESVEREVDIMDIGENYFEVMDMELIEGRNFEKDSERDRRESILVTEEFVKAFGWADNSIGRRVVWMDTVQLYVIGVVKNIYSRALFAPIEPMMIRYTTPQKYRQLVISTDPKKISDVNEFMEKRWKEVFPNSMYNGQLIDRELQETNDINKNIVTMFGFLGFFAALMTGIGLYTLVSLNIVKKMKELGVRKVLGASMPNLVRIINAEFIVNMSIATVFGVAAGYFASDWLMNSIWEYYQRLTLEGLTISIVFMVIIAVLAVGYKTYSTASLNPSHVLRNE